jgi:hypothetical protein
VPDASQLSQMILLDMVRILLGTKLRQTARVRQLNQIATQEPCDR